MDRHTIAEDGIEELGVASVETRGTEFPVPESIGRKLEPDAGISVD
ncbi:hypothetical protein WBQ88_16465 [Sphingopyxis sp. CCNWLW253]